MNDFSNIYSKVGATYDTAYKNKEVDPANAEVASKPKIPGKTIGNPKLSEKAQKYYEELRSKFHNMEFICVSEDQKEAAKAKASSFAQHNKMVVLIDEAKLERMAEDSSFRAKYEQIIENASTGFTQFAESVSSTGANIKGYGMQVNDNGTVSYFAVLKNSSEAQAKRIAEKREEKRNAKKAEEKEARKESLEERIKHSRESIKNKKEKINDSKDVTLTANSLDELLRKIEDYVQQEKADSVLSDGEKTLGQNIDFSA